MARHKRKPHIYAFIDSQNLNLGVGSNITIKDRILYYGWRLDFEKFYHYLKTEHGVERAFLFIGYTEEQEELYETLHSYGYSVVLKPTTSHKDAEGETVVKGNVDTDLVLYAAAREFQNYTKAIVVSGDGDFLSLYEFLDEQNKLGTILIPNKVRYSQLLSPYQSKMDFISPLRKQLQMAPPPKLSSQPKPAAQGTKPKPAQSAPSKTANQPPKNKPAQSEQPKSGPQQTNQPKQSRTRRFWPRRQAKK